MDVAASFLPSFSFFALSLSSSSFIVRSDIKTKGELLLSLIACLNNLTACYLSMKEYAKAKETCVQALSLEPDNVKALIRASKASLALHEYEECAMCLATVSRVD